MNDPALLIFQTRQRRRRRWLWSMGVLVALMVLLEFNPLHPIVWAHQMRDAYQQGLRAGAIARRERAARRAAEQATQRGNPESAR